MRSIEYLARALFEFRCGLFAYETAEHVLCVSNELYVAPEAISFFRNFKPCRQLEHWSVRKSTHLLEPAILDPVHWNFQPIDDKTGETRPAANVDDTIVAQHFVDFVLWIPDQLVQTFGVGNYPPQFFGRMRKRNGEFVHHRVGHDFAATVFGI